MTRLRKAGTPSTRNGLVALPAILAPGLPRERRFMNVAADRDRLGRDRSMGGTNFAIEGQQPIADLLPAKPTGELAGGLAHGASHGGVSHEVFHTGQEAGIVARLDHEPGGAGKDALAR